MKRPPSLDEPVAPRRRRALSEEERALWDGVAKQVKPLRKKPRVAKAAAPKPSPDPKQSKQTPLIPAQAGIQGDTGHAAKSGSPRPRGRAETRSDLTAFGAPPQLPTLGRREKSQLSRGRKEIDARIDLHGMTQARAHRALLGFLQRASHDGMRFVLVITGKGRTVGPESERGVLRRQVPLWLAAAEFRTMVIGYDEAGIGHGGEGALYVRLRRERS